jgi:hypothetical protein
MSYSENEEADGSKKDQRNNSEERKRNKARRKRKGFNDRSIPEERRNAGRKEKEELIEH